MMGCLSMNMVKTKTINPLRINFFLKSHFIITLFSLFAGFFLLINSSLLLANETKQTLLALTQQLEEELGEFSDFNNDMVSINSEILTYKLSFAKLVSSAVTNSLDFKDLQKGQQDIKEVIQHTYSWEKNAVKQLQTAEELYQVSQVNLISLQSAAKANSFSKDQKVLNRYQKQVIQLKKTIGGLEKSIEAIRLFQKDLISWNQLLRKSITGHSSFTILNRNHERSLFSSTLIQKITKDLTHANESVKYIFRRHIQSRDSSEQLSLFVFVSIAILFLIGFSMWKSEVYAKKYIEKSQGEAKWLLSALFYSVLKHRLISWVLIFMSLITTLYLMLFQDQSRIILITLLGFFISLFAWKIGMTLISLVFEKNYSHFFSFSQHQAALLGTKTKQILTAISIIIVFKVPDYYLGYANTLSQTIAYLAYTCMIYFAMILLWQLDLKSLLSKEEKKTYLLFYTAKFVFVSILLAIFLMLILQGVGFYNLSKTIQGILTVNFTSLVNASLIYTLAREVINWLEKVFSGQTSSRPIMRQIKRILLICMNFMSTLMVLGLILFILKPWLHQFFLVEDIWTLTLLQIGTYQLQILQIFQLIISYFTCLLIYHFLVLVAKGFLFHTLQIESSSHGNFYTVLRYGTIFIGTLLFAHILGVTYKNLVIIAGALGVGIGFGLQTIVNNFISGIILLFEKPIRVGDIIEVDGQFSTVTNIGPRSTTVNTVQNSSIVIPNSDIISNKLINWTLSDKIIMLACQVGVAYGSDTKQMESILIDVAQKTEHVLPDPSPVVRLTEFGDSSLNFEVRFWTDQPTLRFEIKNKIMHEIDRKLKEKGITIPFPQRDVHLKNPQ